MKKRSAQLEGAKDHVEIYRLLNELRDWQVKNRLPPYMRAAHGGVNETINLSSNDPEIIDIDKYIFEVRVLLVRLVKSEPDNVATAVHESV